MTPPGLWFRFHVNAHEHPKVIRLRALARNRADAACWGWFGVIVAAAKRYGSWTFADEAHLEHIAGRYYQFVGYYREVGLLDGLTVHDGETYNAPKDPTAAERMRRHRASRDDGDERNDRNAVTPRAEQSRTEQSRATRDDPADDYWTLTGKYPTDRILEWIDDLALTYGTDALRRHLAERATESPETKTLLGRVRDSLKREARQLDRSERAIEERKVEAGRQARANVTLLRAYHNGGAHLEDPKPECPLCSTEPAA